MSPALQSWLDGLPAFPGLLGAYAVEHEQTPTIRSYAEECGVNGIASLHRQVRDVVDVLDTGELPARKLRWIFEHAVVYFERRHDGAGMCLITTHDPWIGEGEIITQVIDAFRKAL